MEGNGTPYEAGNYDSTTSASVECNQPECYDLDPVCGVLDPGLQVSIVLTMIASVKPDRDVEMDRCRVYVSPYNGSTAEKDIEEYVANALNMHPRLEIYTLFMAISSPVANRLADESHEQMVQEEANEHKRRVLRIVYPLIGVFVGFFLLVIVFVDFCKPLSTFSTTTLDGTPILSTGPHLTMGA